MLGAPGFNEPHLLPTMAAGRGGTTGPPNRMATKQRARQAAKEGAAKRRSVTPAVQVFTAGPQESSVLNCGTPSDGTPGSVEGDDAAGGAALEAFHGTMRAVEAGIHQQTAILKEFAESEREKLQLKRSSKRLEELKVLLQYLPPSSTEFKNAIAEIMAMSRAGPHSE